MILSGELWAKGSRDDQAELQALLRRGPVRLESNRVYRIRRPVEVSSGGSIVGDRSSVLSPEGNFPAVVVRGRDVRLIGFAIRGRPHFRSSGNHGVFVDWRAQSGGNVHIADMLVEDISGSGIIALASPGTRSRGFSVDDCLVRRTGAHGIIAQDYIDDVSIERNEVETTSLIVPDRPGITASRYGRRVVVRNNVCRGRPGAGGFSVHGISMDICEDVDCSSNVVSGWTRGYGIELVGVLRGAASSNVITGCRYGIGMPGMKNGITSRDLLLQNNTIKDSIECGIFAIVFEGDGMTQHHQIALRSNTVQGVSGSRIGVGVYLVDIDGLVINDLEVSGSHYSGVAIVDCPNHSLSHIRSHGNNREGNPSHAGLLIAWRKVSSVKQGANALRANQVEDNGGGRNVVRSDR